MEYYEEADDQVRLRSTVGCGEQAEIEEEEGELREEYCGNESYLGRVIKLEMV